MAQSLSENGIEFTALGGIKSNPVLSKVNEGIALAKSFGADSVLSVGGGSCLDSAKAIAAGACYDGDVWDFFTGKKAEKALQIFDVITLAATGSEMNSGGVVTNEAAKQKYAIDSRVLFPKVSVINPELQATVSRDYLVYSASDIIAHSIEAYFTATDRPNIVNRLVENNIKTVLETTETLLSDPDDLTARGDFAWAATLALNGLTHAGIQGYGFPQPHDRTRHERGLRRAARRRFVRRHGLQRGCRKCNACLNMFSDGHCFTAHSASCSWGRKGRKFAVRELQRCSRVR